MNLHFFQWMPRKDIINPPAQIPLILFLHGMGGTGQIWRPIAASLEEEYFCIAPDQRGHGLSRPLPIEDANSFHAKDYAEDLILLLRKKVEELHPSAIYIVGHSMGVRSGLATADTILSSDSELKSLLKGFISVDIGLQSKWGGGIGLPLAQFIQSLPGSFSDRSSLREYLFQKCPDPSIAQYLAAVAKKTNDDPETWKFPFDHNALVQTIFQADEAPIEQWVLKIAGFGIPVLALRGEKSKVWLKEDFENSKTKLASPQVIFEEWPDCGHGLPFEQRPKFIERIREFISHPK